jgi:hypothetical protein
VGHPRTQLALIRVVADSGRAIAGPLTPAE